MGQRKSDKMLDKFMTIGDSYNDTLEKILGVYNSINEFKKNGYKIVAYKEKNTTYEMKDIEAT